MVCLEFRAHNVLLTVQIRYTHTLDNKLKHYIVLSLEKELINSVLRLLVRFTQFVLELSELTCVSGEVSNDELDIQMRIRRIVAALLSWNLTESPPA